MVHHTLFLLILLVFSTQLQAFDHAYTGYSKILATHVKDGLVNYPALQKDRKGIDQFVQSIRATTNDQYRSWSREQQLAFWINAYNGWFLQIVIDHYPIKSGRLLGVFYPDNSVQRIPGIWDTLKIKAAGREVSLNEIEHKIIRPMFKEPRIHFAIVCASVGCPSLQSKAFTPRSLDKQLEDAARKFINDQTKVRWKESEKKLELSKIFNWFSEDFDAAANDAWRKMYSKREAGAVAFVSRYLPAEVGARLKAGGVKVTYIDYDWSLNDFPSSSTQRR